MLRQVMFKTNMLSHYLTMQYSVPRMLGVVNRRTSAALKTIARYKTTIEVTPKGSLVTERVSIRGKGYLPFLPITVKSTVCCEKEKISFTSYAHIVTDEDGVFDLLSSESIGGTYTGVDDMGLFWSMESNPGYLNRFQMNDASIPVQYDFSVMEGHVEDVRSLDNVVFCKTSIERSFLSKGVKRERISEKPLHGTLFVPPGEGPFPAVITIYGGLKRKQVVEDAAALLANNGFVTLTMAFFGHDGLPDVWVTEPVHLDLFQNAVKYLKSLKVVKSDAIGVYGISKGGEVCLASASFIKDIKAAVGVNCGYYATGDYSLANNIVIPFGGYTDMSNFEPDVGDVKEGYLDYHQCPPVSILPIENSEGQLLHIAGLDDRCTPSGKSGAILEDRMSLLGKTNLEVHKFSGMGHLVDAPFAPPSTMSPHVYFPKQLLYFGGGDKRSHNEGVVRVWDTVVSFFKRHLR